MHLNRKIKRRSRWSLLLVLALMLQVLQPFGLAFAGTGQITGFTLEKTASKSVVEVGETFTYTVKYQVDGATQVGKTLIIEDTVPAQFEIVNADDWDQNGQKLSLDLGSIQSGTSGTLTMLVKAKPTGSSSTVSTTNTAVAHVTDSSNQTTDVTASASVTINPDPNPSTPGPSPTPTTPPVTVSTYDQWETYKTQNTGYGSIPIVGGDVVYTVGIRGTAGNTDQGQLTVPDLVDYLPAEAVYVSSTKNGVYDSTAHTVTWSDIVLASGLSFNANVTVAYPADYGYVVSGPVNQVNTVSMSTYTMTGGGAVTKEEAEVTTKFGPPVSGTPGLVKTKQFDYRFPGQKQTFRIGGIANAGANVNSPLSDLVLSDVLPLELDYTSITMPSYQWSSFRYETNEGWQLYSGSVTNAGGTIRVGHAADGLNAGTDIILADDEYLTELEWTFNKLPVGQQINNIVIEGIVREQANGVGTPILVHGDEITNHAVLNYKAWNTVTPGMLESKTPVTAEASFHINNEKPWLTAGKVNTGSNNYRPLSKVPYTLTVGNDIRATGGYNNPVVYDLLPTNFEYYTNPKIVDPADALAESYSLVNAPSGLAKPKLEVTPNFQNTGRTLLKWSWDAPAAIEPGQSFQIKYEASIRAGTPRTDAGYTYTNQMYITTEDANSQFWHAGDDDQDVPDNLAAWQTRNEPIQDVTIGFDPTPGVDEFFVRAEDTVVVKKSSLVQSTKWNRGDLDPIFQQTAGDEYQGQPAISEAPFESPELPAYTEYPYYSVTYEGGTADYKLVIRNSGNTRLGHIDVLDILPFIGDYALRVNSNAPYEARGSEWQPNLAEVLPSGQKVFTSTAATGSRQVEYTLNAFYSKSTNQESIVNFDNVSGSRAGWIPQTSFTSDDLSDIRSLYFELSGIKGSDNLDGLAPGDYIVLDWKMDAPVGAPTNAIAWNSFAIQATEFGSNGTGDSKMLPTAPNKVGFIIDPQDKHVPLGEIGNFVWFDSDGDGTQNEEYPGDSGQGAGINGITVNLYKGADTTPFKSSKTGYHYNGKPGYYLFQGLEAGDYRIEFVVPDFYKTTIANANGNDPAHSDDYDSNLVTLESEGGGYRHYVTDTITLGTAGKNPTIDLGLIETDPPGNEPYPVVELDKSITAVQQGSSTMPASQDYAAAGNQVKYAITLTNKSSVTIHNIRLTDYMDRNQAGFSFTKLQFQGEDIVLSGNSHGRPDVIAGLDNTGSEPHLILKSLGAGQSATLEGIYTVTGADIDLTDLENKVIVYYNESPDPHEDEAAIPTAGLRIEKTGSALSVTTAGTVVDYTVTVFNTGNRDLTNVQVTDTKVSGIPAIPLLKAGESHQITYTYEVTAADLLRPELVNTATAKPDELPSVTVDHEIPVESAPSGSIGNYVWLDSNEDGIQDLNESGINGIIVKLYNQPGGTVIAQAVTREKDGQAGYYTFGGLPEDTYYVQFIYPADYGITKSEEGSSDKDSNKIDSAGYTEAILIGPAGWDDPTIDLGLVPRGEIGNYVWLDRNRDGIQNEDEQEGVNGIEVRLFKNGTSGQPIAVATTADDAAGKPGYYLFDDLLAGDYYVQFVVPIDYELTTAEAGSDVELDSNAIDTDGYTARITIGELPGWIDHSIDLGLIAKGVIGDYVWLDSNKNGKQDEAVEAGRNGIKVQLYDKDKHLLSETLTANDADGHPGYYRFDQLIGGEYYIKFLPPSAYTVTKAEAEATTEENDSNGWVGGYTKVIVIGEGAPHGWEDLTIDLGLYFTPSPPVIPVDPDPGTPNPGGPVDPVDPGTDPKPPVGKPDPDPEQPVKEKPPVQTETTTENKPVEGHVDIPTGGQAEVGKQPDNGKVTIDKNGNWTYTPKPGFVGKDQFSVIVTNADGEEEEFFFDIDVEEVPLGGIDLNGGKGGQSGHLPKTGESSSLPWQAAGIALIGAGIMLRHKWWKRS